jgi:hypothetical protein
VSTDSEDPLVEIPITMGFRRWRATRKVARRASSFDRSAGAAFLLSSSGFEHSWWEDPTSCSDVKREGGV